MTTRFRMSRYNLKMAPRPTNIRSLDVVDELDGLRPMAVDLAQASITIKLELGEERLHGCRSIRSRPSAPITNPRGDLYAPAEASRAPGGDRREAETGPRNVRLGTCSDRRAKGRNVETDKLGLHVIEELRA